MQNAPEKPSLPAPASVIAEPGVYMSAPDLGGFYPPNIFNDPTSSTQYKPYSNEETSIDLKGVRNLHIFFNDENRVRVHKDNVQSCTVDLENNEAGEGCSQQINGQRVDSDNHGTSWHIKIGKGKDSSNEGTISTTRNDNYGGTIGPPEINENTRKIDKLTAVKCNDTNNMSESPVLKLQIKKAEIVIKFGQKSSGTDLTALDDKQSEDRTNDASLNIQIDSREKDRNDPIVIDLVQNTYDQAKAISESTDSKNPVQIRLDFRQDCEGKAASGSDEVASPTMKDSAKDALLTEATTWVESETLPGSEPGSGSQSPLLTSKVDTPN